MRQRALALFFAVYVAGVQIAELIAVTGAVGLALVMILEVNAEKRRPLLTVDDWGLVAFLFASVFFPLWTGSVPNGTALARLFALAMIPVVAAAAFRLSPEQLRRALLAGGVVLLLSCAVAALQHFGAWPAAEQMQPLEALKLPFTRVYEEVPGAPGRFMAGGLLFHRLKFAHVTGLGVLAAAAIAFRATGRDRLIAGVIAAVGLVSVLWFPYARAAGAALLGALLVLALIIALSSTGTVRRAVIGAAVAVPLLAALLLAFNAPLRARLLSAESDEGSGGRTYLFRAGLAALREKPLTGVGLGRFKAAEWAPAGAPPYVTEHQGKTHNQLLSIAAESGLITLVLFVTYLIALAVRFKRSASPPSGPASLAFFLALGLLHDPLFHAELGLALGLALGAPLMLGLRRGAGPAPTAPARAT